MKRANHYFTIIIILTAALILGAFQLARASTGPAPQLEASLPQFIPADQPVALPPIGNPPAAQAPAAAIETDPEQVVRAFHAAINAGDLDMAMSLYDENVVNAAIPPPPGLDMVDVSREETREGWRQVLAAKSTFKITDYHVNGNKVGWTAAVSDDDLHALGVAPLMFDGVDIVQNGQIVADIWVMTAESRGRLEAAVAREMNKSLAQQLLDEVWNQGNMATADELISLDFVDHAPDPGMTPDRDGLKQAVADFHKSFGGKFTADDVIAFEDKVVMRGAFQGTHSGEYMGVPATRKKVTLHLDGHLSPRGWPDR